MKLVMEDIFLKLMVSIQKKLHDLHNDLPFLPERSKIEKVGKLITNLNDKSGHVLHIRNLKQTLNHR